MFLTAFHNPAYFPPKQLDEKVGRQNRVWVGSRDANAYPMDLRKKAIKLSDASSRSLESSGTVFDVTYTIHPYHFSSMLMELGWTTTMTRCALDPDGTL